MKKVLRVKLYQHFYNLLLNLQVQKISDGHNYFEYDYYTVHIYSMTGSCSAIISVDAEDQTITLANGETITTAGYIEIERFPCSGWRDGARQTKSYLLGLLLKSRGFKIKDIHP